MFNKLIYRQVGGKFRYCLKAVLSKEVAERCNFIIQWKGRDWSGFRTLAECCRQFPEIESRSDATEDNFTVIER